MKFQNLVDGELQEESTCKEFLQVQTEGIRQRKAGKILEKIYIQKLKIEKNNTFGRRRNKFV